VLSFPQSLVTSLAKHVEDKYKHDKVRRSQPCHSRRFRLETFPGSGKDGRKFVYVCSSRQVTVIRWMMIIWFSSLCGSASDL